MILPGIAGIGIETGGTEIGGTETGTEIGAETEIEIEIDGIEGVSDPALVLETEQANVIARALEVASPLQVWSLGCIPSPPTLVGI